MAEGVLQLVVVTGTFLYLFAPLPESVNWVQIAPDPFCFRLFSGSAHAAIPLWLQQRCSSRPMLVSAVVLGFGRLGDVAIPVMIVSIKRSC